MQVSNKQFTFAAVLVLLMAATRMHHFGDATHLPDASLAVFLLAGMLVASPLFFVGLLLEAGVMDYLATAQFGVSDYCLTPAYGFLIPTYAVLWFAGRYYQRVHQANSRGFAIFTGISFVAMSVAFLISNFSFYWLSGRYDALNIGQYVNQIAQYYPQYLAGGAIYLTCAVIVYAAVQVYKPLLKQS